MRLHHLREAIQPEQVIQFNADLEITGLSLDSRKVKPGHLFAALPGQQTDGTRFVLDAVKKGAVAVLTESPTPLSNLPQLVVPHARAAIGRAARYFYAAPDTRLRVGGITGTNGKSTSAYLVRHLLNKMQTPCGLLGTIEYDLGAEIVEAPMTTPEATEVYSYFRTMADRGMKAAVIEVSSHSLSQRRVEGLNFQAAMFTNLTQDHLDYHRTMEAYREAKGLLFRGLNKGSLAVLNMDDPTGHYYAEITRADILGFSMQEHSKADLHGKILGMDIHGTTFEIRSPWGKREVRWKLVGKHNIENALGSLGLALVLGSTSEQTFNFDSALSALECFDGVPGRLQPVDLPGIPFRVLVDYAHTDDALRAVLKSLRELKPSRLITVFGCGGDRDSSKRPKMGQAVESLSDLGVVTNDNPRTEDPRRIIGDIWKGITHKNKFTVEPDRATAIDLAIREARPGDVVLLAGKGHENYQIVGNTKRHFDDREAAMASLQRRFGPLDAKL